MYCWLFSQLLLILFVDVLVPVDLLWIFRVITEKKPTILWIPLSPLSYFSREFCQSENTFLMPIGYTFGWDYKNCVTRKFLLKCLAYAILFQVGNCDVFLWTKSSQARRLTTDVNHILLYIDLNQIDIRHPYVMGTQICWNDRPCPFLKRGNNEIVKKIH